MLTINFIIARLLSCRENSLYNLSHYGNETDYLLNSVYCNNINYN